jgi:hypothetical protein
VLFGAGEELGGGHAVGQAQPHEPAAVRRRHVERRPQRVRQRVAAHRVRLTQPGHVLGERTGRAERRHRQRVRVVHAAAAVHVAKSGQPAEDGRMPVDEAKPQPRRHRLGERADPDDAAVATRQVPQRHRSRAVVAELAVRVVLDQRHAGAARHVDEVLAAVVRHAATGRVAERRDQVQHRDPVSPSTQVRDRGRQIGWRGDKADAAVPQDAQREVVRGGVDEDRVSWSGEQLGDQGEGVRSTRRYEKAGRIQVIGQPLDQRARAGDGPVGERAPAVLAGGRRGGGQPRLDRQQRRIRVPAPEVEDAGPFGELDDRQHTGW